MSIGTTKIDESEIQRYTPFSRSGSIGSETKAAVNKYSERLGAISPKCANTSMQQATDALKLAADNINYLLDDINKDLDSLFTDINNIIENENSIARSIR